MLLRLGQLLFRRRRRLSRRAALPWAALAALPALGLVLGLIAPASTTELEFGRRDSSAPRLLAGQYHDATSTLWLVAADDLSGQRIRLADVPHAPGWDIAAAAAPGESVAAVLSLPPRGWEPKTQAALDLYTEHGARRLAAGLDLSGGVIWSDDGEHLLVRRGGAILVLDSDTGEPAAEWSLPGADGVYPVAMRGDRLWATTIDAWGTSLIELSLINGRAAVQERIRISDRPTRDWTLSPNADLLAFGEQRGAELSVRVAALRADSANPPLLLSSADGAAARMAISDISSGDGILRSASPVWRADGGLDFGSWPGSREDESGFTLPLSWDASGRWLAVRWFSGTGPDEPGVERAAVRGPDGNLSSAKDDRLQLFGWWRE